MADYFDDDKSESDKSMSDKSMSEESMGDESMEPEVAEAAPAPEVYVPEMPEIKLFGKWSLDEIQINDTSLMDYIAVSKTHSRYLPHSAGRFGAKRFGKAACPIIERIVNSLMMHGRNN